MTSIHGHRVLAVKPDGPLASGRGRALGCGVPSAREGDLKAETIAEFARLHTPGTDVVTGIRDGFALGFEAMGVKYPDLGADAFGHSAEALADPSSGIAYGYTRRRFAYPPGPGAPENRRLIAALRRAAI